MKIFEKYGKHPEKYEIDVEVDLREVQSQKHELHGSKKFIFCRDVFEEFQFRSKRTPIPKLTNFFSAF